MILQNSITPKQTLETAMVFALVAISVGVYKNLLFLFYVAGALLLIALIVPYMLKPLAYLWFGLSKILGWVISRIILSVIYYVLVTPVGLIRRVIGADSLLLKCFGKNKKTAFKDRKHVFKAEDLLYPF